MAQLPNVRLKLHPSAFNLMMAILEGNMMNASDDSTRRAAKDMFDKRMRFTQLCDVPGKGEYTSVRMYESEAAEIIWQLLYAFSGNYDVTREYSKELKRGGGICHAQEV